MLRLSLDNNTNNTPILPRQQINYNSENMSNQLNVLDSVGNSSQKNTELEIRGNHRDLEETSLPNENEGEHRCETNIERYTNCERIINNIETSCITCTKIYRDYIMLSHVKSKALYTDPYFPASENSLYGTSDGESKQRIIWLRAQNVTLEEESEELIPWSVYKSPRPSDVVQGTWKNCWLLSPLSVLAEREDIFQRIFESNETCPQGMYLIKVCKVGYWGAILVDDLFPCDENGILECSRAKRNQLWVSLIEKAFAKLYGSYDALNGGAASDAFSLLTGFPCETVIIHWEGVEIWETLLLSHVLSFPMCASCGSISEKPLPDWAFEEVGLQNKHCYSIISVVHFDGVELVQLRNPWGHSEWNGDWSHDSPLWTDERREALMQNELEPGVFWMPFNEFCKYFFAIDICRTRIGWYERRFNDIFYSNGCSYVIYILTVYEETDIDILLFQDDLRNFINLRRKVLCKLSMCVTHCNQWNPRDDYVVASSDPENSVSSCLSLTLRPGKYKIDLIKGFSSPLVNQVLSNFSMTVSSERPICCEFYTIVYVKNTY